MNPWKNADLLLFCLTAMVVFTVATCILSEFGVIL